MRHPLGTFELVVFTQNSVGGALSGRKHGHFMGTSPTALSWPIFANAGGISPRETLRHGANK